jgi:hypothetical protein
MYQIFNSYNNMQEDGRSMKYIKKTLFSKANNLY